MLTSTWGGGSSVGRMLHVVESERSGGDKGEFEFVASTSGEAADGDIIDQSTWKLERYRSNPVVLDNHNMSVVVGRARVQVVESGLAGGRKLGKHLRAWISFDEELELGRTLARQHKEGYRNAISVRWSPDELIRRADLDEDDEHYQAEQEVSTPFGTFRYSNYVHRGNTLLENSSVSIPSDPAALQSRALRGHLGMDAYYIPRDQRQAAFDEARRSFGGGKKVDAVERLLADPRFVAAVGQVRVDQDLIARVISELESCGYVTKPEEPYYGDGHRGIFDKVFGTKEAP